jgi:hypothetical protein
LICPTKKRESTRCASRSWSSQQIKKTCQIFFYKYKKGWLWREPKHMLIFKKIKKGEKAKYMLEIF